MQSLQVISLAADAQRSPRKWQLKNALPVDPSHIAASYVRIKQLCAAWCLLKARVIKRKFHTQASGDNGAVVHGGLQQAAVKTLHLG